MTDAIPQFVNPDDEITEPYGAADVPVARRAERVCPHNPRPLAPRVLSSLIDQMVADGAVGRDGQLALSTVRTALARPPYQTCALCAPGRQP